MKKISGLMMVAFILSLPFLNRPAIAAAEALQAVHVAGSVTVNRGGQAFPLHEGDALQVGDQITTDGQGRLEAVKAGDWGFRLLQSGNGRIAAADQIELNQGNIILNVKPRADQKFSVKTPVVVASVRGTQFWGQVTPAGASHNSVFAVRQGKVEVEVLRSGEKMMLEAGQAVEIQGAAGTAGQRAAKDAELEAIRQAEEIVL